jgi:hypothetical protein
MSVIEARHEECSKPAGIAQDEAARATHCRLSTAQRSLCHLHNLVKPVGRAQAVARCVI